MKNPVNEGIVLACQSNGIHMKHVPRIQELVFANNPQIKQAYDMVNTGEIKVC